MRRSATSSGHQQLRLRARTASTRAMTLVLLGLVWFMICAAFQVSSVPGTTGRTTAPGTMVLSTELLKRYLKLVARQEMRPRGPSEDLDLNYVSKRRVPNGPDPIHNRLIETKSSSQAILAETSSPLGRESTVTKKFFQ